MINCSQIILTYNRPSYLKRILGYYSSYETAYNMIVADSSLDENKELNKNIISSVSNLDIHYLDNYSSRTNPYHKIADAVNHVKTEYCVICADDDFTTPNGINQSVNFLKGNPDFTVAQGHYIRFYLKTDEEEKQQFRWGLMHPPKSITFPDAKDRFVSHFSTCYQTFFGVHRTDFLKMIFEETLRFTDDLPFGELLTSMLTLIHGKMECLDVLFIARDAGSVMKDADPEYFYTLKDFVREGTYDEKYARFRDCLSAHLSKQAQLDIKEARKVVENAMSAYVKRKYYPSVRSKLLTSKMKDIKDILDNLGLPDWLDRGIRSSYRELTRSSRTKKHSLDMSPSSKYYDDFNRIRLHVLSRSKISLE